MLSLSDKVCLKCGGTGTLINGDICDCGASMKMDIPVILEVPTVYQVAEYSAVLVPMLLSREYGVLLEDILEVIKKKGRYDYNLLICSPPNTGKTVFAYTAYKSQYLKGLPMSNIMDLYEIKDIMVSNSYDDKDISEKNKLFTCPLLIVKVPLDLPNKFAETMSTLIERRMRKNGCTIFLYGGSIYDLYNQDKFGVLKSVVKDGSYNSLKVINYQNIEREGK